MSDSWSGYVCRVHIAIQKVQAVALILYRLVFQLSGKVVVMLLHNSTAKAYLCNQGGTVSLFPDLPVAY